MNLESTLSNGDDLVKSPDTSSIPDTDLSDTTPITTVDADDGKTTVIVVQAPAAESSEEQSVDAAAEGEEVSAAGALLTTSVDPHTEDSTVTVATLLSSIGEVFTAAIGWVGTVASTIAGQPILLIACVAIPLCGLGVGLFKRLLSAKA